MKKVGVFLSVIMILFISNHVCAQFRNLEGVVSDIDNKPLANVEVSLKGLDRTVKTNDNGFYRFDEVPDTIQTLVFTLKGMKQASATIGFYDRIDVIMSKVGESDLIELSLEDLMNLEITTASKTAEKLSDAPGIVSVLTKDEISRYGGTTLKELLEKIPGLIGSTVYMTDRSTIAPRGDQVLASSSHVLLLVNGRPVREALEGGIKSEMYEAFPVNIIERIEVIRGPGSVLYGSNAFSAVINVITEKAENNNLSVSGQAGLEGGFGTQAKARFKSGDFNVSAAARYFQKSEWETGWKFATATGDTTVDVSIPNTSIGAYFDASYKNLRLMTSYTEWEHYYFVTDYAAIFPAYGKAKWKKGFVDLGYNLQAAENWNMDFNVTYTRSTFKTQNWPNTNRDSYEVVGEWTNFYNPTDKLGIVFGGLFNYFDGEEWGPISPTETFTFTDANRYSAGAYAQINYRLLPSLNLIGGVQANKVEDIDLNVVPRAGLIWYPVKKINVKAFYSQAFRAPSINEFSIDFPAMQGNPDLVPEKVSTIDVGIGYQGEQMNLGVSFFYSQMENIIFQNRDTTVVPVPMYWNGGEVTFTGIEFEGKYYINKQLYISGSMLYHTNEDKDGNKNVTPIPNFGAKAGISYVKEGLTLSLFDNYQGDPDEKYQSLLNPSPEAYHLIYLNAEYDFRNLLNLNKVNHLSLFMKVDNVLDKEIWLTDWGLTPGKSIPVNPGREIYIGFRLGF